MFVVTDLKSENGTKTNKIFLLLGKEEYLKRDFERRARAKILSDDKSGLNLEILEADDLSASRIIDFATTLPFISKNRLIIARDVDKLPPNEREIVLNYLKKPSDTCYIIFETSIHGRDNFIESLKKSAKTFEFDKLSKKELSGWIIKRLAENGKKLSGDALQQILSVIPNDLELISNELDKLSSYCGKRNVITKKDIDEVVLKSLQETAFDMVDFLARKKFDSALKIGLELYSDRKRLPELVGLVGWQLKRLIKIKELVKMGLLPGAIARELHIHEFIARKLVDEANSFAPGQLKKMLIALVKADSSLKTGTIDAKDFLEIMISELSNARA